MTELAIHHDGSITEFQPVAGARRELLKRTICRDLTDDEMDLFVAVCNRRRLDPFVRQIHAVKRKQWNAKLNDGQGGYEEVMTIQTGIDGFRLVAERTHERDGTDGPWWCGDDGQWRDVWLSSAPPAAAKVIAYRRGHGRSYTGIAHWTEYVQTYRDKNGNTVPTQMWRDMPAGQLAKCAEALAWRKAFPEELAGIYTDDEMAQADNGGSVVVEASGGPAVEPVPAGPPAPISRLPTIDQINNITTVQQAKGLVKVAPQQYKDDAEATIRARHPGVLPADWWKACKDVQEWRFVLLDALDPSGSEVVSAPPGDPEPDAPSPSAPVHPDAGSAEGDHPSGGTGSLGEGEPGPPGQPPRPGRW